LADQLVALDQQRLLAHLDFAERGLCGLQLVRRYWDAVVGHGSQRRRAFAKATGYLWLIG
jgi:hypothetical protein